MMGYWLGPNERALGTSIFLAGVGVAGIIAPVLITTLAAGVDASVKHLGWTYEIHGLVQLVTSYDGSASVVNQVQNVYNGFRQLVTQYQEHGGAVNTASTPAVLYSYADGSTNTIRPTALTYPNGRQLNYLYNAGNDDAYAHYLPTYAAIAHYHGKHGDRPLATVHPPILISHQNRRCDGNRRISSDQNSDH